MNNSPLVSIIVPTFNRKELLSECLESLLHQEYENWECIVVDDNSTLPYINLLRKEYEIRDSRFRFFSRPKDYPSGASACRNYGFLQSNGKYIQWLDDDDFLSNNKISAQIKQLESIDSELTFSFCSWDLFWPGKKLEIKNPFDLKNEVHPSDFFNIIGLNKTFLPCSAYLTSSTLIKRSGLWDLRLTLNDDAEFFSRVLTESELLVNCPESYVLYRAHSGERISEQISAPHVKSFLLSLNLMQAHLTSKKFKCKKYFRWKLLQIIFKYGKQHSQNLKHYSFLFSRFGLSLQFKNIYVWRYRLYKKVYPVYKKYLKN